MYTQKMMDEDLMCEKISDQIESVNSYMQAEQVKLVSSLTLEDSYSYKGSLNCNLMICTMDDGTIQLFSQYGERMGIFTSVKALAVFLHSLMDDKYA